MTIPPPRRPDDLDARGHIALVNGPDGVWGCDVVWSCTTVCPRNMPPTKGILTTRERIGTD